jgi:hypothetical protein
MAIAAFARPRPKFTCVLKQPLAHDCSPLHKTPAGHLTPRSAAPKVATRNLGHHRDNHLSDTTKPQRHLTMVMHASFLQSMQQAGVHLRDYLPPPLPPRRDPFATLNEKTRTMIIKDILFHKYISNTSSSSSELSHFDDLVLADHDGLFDWLKQRLDTLDYATKPKRISY